MPGGGRSVVPRFALRAYSRSAWAAAIAARRRTLREWEQSNAGAVYDPDVFRREILPRLGDVRLTEIMAAAGMSKSLASAVRRGRYTPHVSTWGALARLVGIRSPGRQSTP